MMLRKRVLLKKEGAVATDLLNRMLIAFSYSSMLRTDHGLTSIQILDIFKEFGCVPDLESYTWAAATCQNLNEDDPSVARIRQNMFDLLRSQPVEQGELFYFIRLLSYKDETLCLAVDMLADLSSDARTSKGSAAAFSSVVTGLCRKHDVHGANKLMEEMILKGPPPGIKAFNALIKSLCLTGDLEGAFDMLQLTES